MSELKHIIRTLNDVNDVELQILEQGRKEQEKRIALLQENQVRIRRLLAHINARADVLEQNERSEQ